VWGLASLLAPLPARAQNPRAGDPQAESENKQPSRAASLTVASQGRSQPNYQVFAYKTPLPQVLELSNLTVAVGAVVINLSSANRIPPQDKQALAGLLGVPVSVVQRVLARVSRESGGDPERFRQDLHDTVMDYKYLRDRWARYHPPAESTKEKTEALAALEDGDVDKAWEIFRSLPRPQPPGVPRIVGLR